jgi:hypothetical protein
MVDAGQAAAWYQDRVLRNLTCRRIQVDEIWAFVYGKQRTWRPGRLWEIGDIVDVLETWESRRPPSIPLFLPAS